MKITLSVSQYTTVPYDFSLIACSFKNFHFGPGENSIVVGDKQDRTGKKGLLAAKLKYFWRKDLTLFAGSRQKAQAASSFFDCLLRLGYFLPIGDEKMQ